MKQSPSFVSTFETEQKVNRCHRRCVIGKVKWKRLLADYWIFEMCFPKPLKINFTPELPSRPSAHEIRADLERLRRNCQTVAC